MQFGLVLSDIGVALAESRYVESAGWGAIACGEHVFFPRSDTNNSLVLLAAASGATDRVRLVSTVTLAPLYPTALLAKQVATLALVSGERFELGLGVGGEFPAEFAAVGAEVGTRGRVTDAAIDLIRTLLGGSAIRVADTDLVLQPRPTRSPPIWIGGRGASAHRRAALLGDGYLPYMYTPRMLDDAATGIREMRSDNNDRFRFGLLVHVHVDSDPRSAERRAVEHVTRVYRGRVGRRILDYLLAGDENIVRRRIDEYRQAGADTLFFSLACEPDERAPMLRRLTDIVVSA